jgi:hypothetical protein
LLDGGFDRRRLLRLYSRHVFGDGDGDGLTRFAHHRRGRANENQLPRLVCFRDFEKEIIREIISAKKMSLFPRFPMVYRKRNLQ